MEDMSFYKALGPVLKDIRKKKKVTQKQVANKLGVSKMMVSHWERGNRTIMAHQLVDYCGALGVTVQSVFDRM